MSLRMQALLLRFLENGEIQRVGADRVQTADNVRVITATNRNLVERVASKDFREDLYYRMNVIHIVIPPLRERSEDVTPLVAYFLDSFSAMHRVPRPVLSEQVLEKLNAYSWPGNVRELRNIIERLVVRNRAGVIAPADLPREVMSASATRPSVVGPEPVRRSNADLLYERMVDGGESFWTVVYSPFMSRDLTRDDLRALVARGLEQTRGSYKGLVELFNLSSHDYKRFLNFLRKYECRLPFQGFRTVPSSAGRAATSAVEPAPFVAKSYS
jgi:DNA-binding NtrC family response regulator